MKAVYIQEYGSSSTMQFGEIEKPTPGEKEVIIHMKAASVNPVDWKVREGNLSFVTGKKFPFVLGTELSGVVEDAGSKVKGFKKGDRVYAAIGYKGGAYAEYVAVKYTHVIRIPDELSHETASTLAVAGATPLQAFTIHYRVKPGDEVLVNGASGGVGMYAVQIAKILGARVTAVCSARNEEFVKNLGADEVIDYRKEDFRSRKNAYHVILDAASNADFNEVQQCLKRGGMLIKLNLSIKSILTRIRALLFSSKNLKLILLKNRHADLKWLIEQILEGHIKVHLEKIFPIEQAKEALDESQDGHVRGKIVLQNEI